MEASHVGSSLLNPDQLDHGELPEELAQIERQESMFGQTEFDGTGFEDSETEDQSFAEGAVAQGGADPIEEGDEATLSASADSLPLEEPDEPSFTSLGALETASKSVSHSVIGAPEAESPGESGLYPPVALTVDDFAALEERVLKAVSLVRREREARLVAETRLLELEGQTLAQAAMVEQLHQEIDLLRTEREQVRQRVERLLSQLDALEL